MSALERLEEAIINARIAAGFGKTCTVELTLSLEEADQVHAALLAARGEA